MHHPAWEIVAAQIDHEEPAAGSARPQMPDTDDGERGHILPQSCLTVMLPVGIVEVVMQ